MEFDIKELEKFGLNTSLGIDYTGSREKYFRALERYCSSHEQNRTRVLEAIASTDVDNYIIIVHSLKSNSKMIGATELSSGFEVLEMAARDGDIARIVSETSTILDYYDALAGQLKRFCKSAEEPAAEKISADEARKTYDELLEALDEYDDELSAKLVNKLSGYPFEKNEKDMLSQASLLIGDFRYDDAADFIQQLLPALK